VKERPEEELHDDPAGLQPEEVADRTLLQARLSMTLEEKLRQGTAPAQ